MGGVFGSVLSEREANSEVITRQNLRLVTILQKPFICAFRVCRTQVRLKRLFYSAVKNTYYQKERYIKRKSYWQKKKKFTIEFRTKHFYDYRVKIMSFFDIIYACVCPPKKKNGRWARGRGYNNALVVNVYNFIKNEIVKKKRKNGRKQKRNKRFSKKRPGLLLLCVI